MQVRGWWTMLATLVAPAMLGAASSASAQTARAQFGIWLVIEPACPDNAPKLIDNAAAAASLAGQHLQAPPQTLSADHDLDTGYWLVRSDQGAVLRIEKCTGAISLPDAPQQNARSLAEPGASQASD